MKGVHKVEKPFGQPSLGSFICTFKKDSPKKEQVLIRSDGSAACFRQTPLQHGSWFHFFSLASPPGKTSSEEQTMPQSEFKQTKIKKEQLPTQKFFSGLCWGWLQLLRKIRIKRIKSIKNSWAWTGRIQLLSGSALWVVEQGPREQ